MVYLHRGWFLFAVSILALEVGLDVVVEGARNFLARSRNDPCLLLAATSGKSAKRMVGVAGGGGVHPPFSSAV